MRFRKSTSFNSHDSSYAREGNRLVIKNGIKARCELAVNAVLRFTQGANVKMLTQDINKRLGSKYDEGDIQYALGRLVAEGIVKVKEGKYRATPSTRKLWSAMPKKVQ